MFRGTAAPAHCGLTWNKYMILLIYVKQCRFRANTAPPRPDLPGTQEFPPPPVRSPPGVFRRRPPLHPSRPTLRLHPRQFPPPLPPVAAEPDVGILPLLAPRTPSPSSQGSRASADRHPAQTEPLH